MGDRATYKSMATSVPEDWAIVGTFRPANLAKLPDAPWSALENVA